MGEPLLPSSWNSGIVDATIQFRWPDGEIIRGVEILMIPAEYLLALLARQSRPGGALFAQRPREALAVFLGIFNLRLTGFC